MENDPTTPLLYTPESAAKILAQSRSSVYALMKSGEIRSLKIGRSRRISLSALTEYVESLQVAS